MPSDSVHDCNNRSPEDKIEQALFDSILDCLSGKFAKEKDVLQPELIAADMVCKRFAIVRRDLHSLT